MNRILVKAGSWPVITNQESQLTPPAIADDMVPDPHNVSNSLTPGLQTKMDGIFSVYVCFLK